MNTVVFVQAHSLNAIMMVEGLRVDVISLKWTQSSFRVLFQLDAHGPHYRSPYQNLGPKDEYSDMRVRPHSRSGCTLPPGVNCGPWGESRSGVLTFAHGSILADLDIDQPSEQPSEVSGGEGSSKIYLPISAEGACRQLNLYLPVVQRSSTISIVHYLR